MSKFRQLLQDSLKSNDTEEWIDIYFTRPIGLVFALMWKRLGVHPNAITVLSIFLGVGAGVMFAYTDFCHNVLGIVLLMLANFCDSTDGQLARLTGQKTLLGRVLDGFSGDLWFFSIYVAIVVRLWPQTVPGTEYAWGVWGLVLAAVAGFLCHSPQSSLADYYRQIHLFFLKGREGSELDTSERQVKTLESLPNGGTWLQRVFYRNYASYCRSQEKRTPKFQEMASTINSRYGSVAKMPDMLKKRFIDGSRPLMKYTNILTFNIRAIVLYITCVAGCPWVYLVFELTVMNIIYIYMHHRHECLCEYVTKTIDDEK